MDSQKYVDILESNLLPFYDNFNNDIIFQHDNDPKHTSIKTKKFLEDNKIKVLELPSNSPDLNPIENLWKKLKDRVNKKIQNHQKILLTILRKNGTK